MAEHSLPSRCALGCDNRSLDGREALHRESFTTRSQVSRLHEEPLASGASCITERGGSKPVRPAQSLWKSINDRRRKRSDPPWYVFCLGARLPTKSFGLVNSGSNSA